MSLTALARWTALQRASAVRPLNRAGALYKRGAVQRGVEAGALNDVPAQRGSGRSPRRLLLAVQLWKAAS